MTIITNSEDSRQLPVELMSKDTDWRQILEKLQVENKRLGIKL